MIPADDFVPTRDEWCYRLDTELRDPGQCRTCGGWWSVRAPDGCCPPCHFAEPETQQRALQLRYDPSCDYDPADLAWLKDRAERIPLSRRPPGPRREKPLGSTLEDARQVYRTACSRGARYLSREQFAADLQVDERSLRRRLRNDYGVTWTEFASDLGPI